MNGAIEAAAVFVIDVGGGAWSRAGLQVNSMRRSCRTRP